jgi:hypothetical protein
MPTQHPRRAATIQKAAIAARDERHRRDRDDAKARQDEPSA